MANLFEQFHADFPGAQGFQDLPVKEKKKKKKNIFAKIGSRAVEELSAGLVSPAMADDAPRTAPKDESSQAQIEAALDHIADLQATGVTGRPKTYSAQNERQREELGQQMSGWAARGGRGRG